MRTPCLEPLLFSVCFNAFHVNVGAFTQSDLPVSDMDLPCSEGQKENCLRVFQPKPTKKWNDGAVLHASQRPPANGPESMNAHEPWVGKKNVRTHELPAGRCARKRIGSPL